MLTENIATHLGLCNGAMGVIRDIWYDSQDRPGDKRVNMPEYIFVEFPNFSGVGFVENCKIVPIKPKFASWNRGQKYFIEQFPLNTAYAMTIYKSQGQTFDKVYVDLGARECGTKETYVALSRPRRFEDLKIKNLTVENFLNRFVTE